jgi:hypothetical protein
LSNSKGALYALQKLDSAVASFDTNTKLGRDVHKLKNEIVTRLAYNQRTVEEHEHVSGHICENELTKVYAEHLKSLQGRITNLDLLSSNEESQLVYEYTNSSLRYTILPITYTSLSVFLINYYSAGLVYTLGTSSPLLLSLAAIYAGAKRAQWLRAGDSIIKGSTLVKKMYFKGNTLEIESFNKKIHTLDFSQATIKKVDNDARRESYYLVKDYQHNTLFVLPIVQDSLVNQKYLDWFVSLRNPNSEYSIRHVLMQGNKKVIDLNKGKYIKSEIETLARINLVSQKGVDLSILSTEEIHQAIGSVSDSEVSEYLKNTNTKLSEVNTPSLESNLVSVENLLNSFGVAKEEAVKMTKYLRDNFKINNVKDLSYLKGSELEDAFSECVKSSDVAFKNLKTNVDAFFKFK